MAKTYINIHGDVRDASSLTVPADRDFRGAWEYDDDVVKTDMVEAVEIQKDKIRAERTPEMEKLDVEFMRGLEKGADVAAVSAKKVALRDVTADPRLAAAANPDELKVLDLAALLA